jgi:hypothetical protein
MPALQEQISPEAKTHLEDERARIVEIMQREHPGMRLRDIGEIAYRKDRTPPEEILKRGGFIPQSKNVRLATATARDAPGNAGLVDFSFVPEVAALFSANKNPGDYYLYATPVDKGYLMPGQWRQVAAPAMPLTEFLVARKVLSVSNVTKRAELGEPIVVAGKISPRFAADKAFQRFVTATHLDIPQDIGLGDENYDPHYDIRDTAVSKRFFPSR